MRQLLDLTFDTGLWLVLDEHPRVAQHIGVQLGFARAVTTHGVQVHTGLQHVGGNDGGVGLVGRYRGDDVHAFHCLGYRAGPADGQAAVFLEVGDKLGGGQRVGVVGDDFFDAQVLVEGQGLEFALRAVADQRHLARVRAGQCLGCHQRSRCGAQGGGDGQFGQQHRVTGVDIGQYTEGHHRMQVACSIGRVAVDVFEGIAAFVGDRHQFDHAHFRVAGNARGLVKRLPAFEIVPQGSGKLANKRRYANVMHQVRHGWNINEIRHALAPCYCALAQQCGVSA